MKITFIDFDNFLLNMPKLILISFGENVSNIITVASEIGYDVTQVEQDINNLESFSLKQYAGGICFIAFKKSFLGLPVKYIFKEARLHGVQLINIISRSCVVSAGVQIGTNLYLGRSVNVKDGASLENCVMIDNGSTIGVDARVGSFSSIGEDVQISSNCKVGEHCYIGNRAVIHSSFVGDFCCLEKPLLYDEIYPPRTHLLIGHRSPIEDL